jgi:hypothetical protein
MTEDKILEKFRTIVNEAAQEASNNERNSVRSVLLQYVNMLADSSINGIQFEWLSGSMHIKASIAVGPTVQTILFCLHENECDFNPRKEEE